MVSIQLISLASRELELAARDVERFVSVSIQLISLASRERLGRALPALYTR